MTMKEIKNRGETAYCGEEEARWLKLLLAPETGA